MNNALRAFHIIILIVCAAILVAAFVFEMDALGLRLFGWKWPVHCALYHTFGIKCAFCGMSRSFIAMAGGEVQKAWGYHRLGAAFFAFILLQIPYRIRALMIYPKRVARAVRKPLLLSGIGILIAIFANWLFYLGGQLL